MTQAVNRQHLTAEARVRSRTGSCLICGGQSDTLTSFVSSELCFSLSVSFHQYSISTLHSPTIHAVESQRLEASLTMAVKIILVKSSSLVKAYFTENL
jgi:NAD(P)H-hydrate repair Nnr-like enzyme with NAD(P)H-hydrate dehydratase domain